MTIIVSDEGVWLSAPHKRPLVVSLDGQYVWSFTSVRDGNPRGSGVLVPWPAAPTTGSAERVQCDFCGFRRVRWVEIHRSWELPASISSSRLALRDGGCRCRALLSRS
jgi:hypothetical protein